MEISDIKKAYLKAVGNPESGDFAELADKIAETICEECCPKEAKSFTPVVETRIAKVSETR